MKQVTYFDLVFTNLVGRIPKSLHKPFDALGYMTMPVLWASYLIIFILFSIQGDASITAHLLVLCFIPLATIMKLFIRRQRPLTIYAEAMKVKSYSFPSSHAYCAALVGGYFAHLAFSAGLIALGATLLLAIFIIGLSRIHLGAHYPSDVAAGWILGLGFLAALQIWF